MRAISDTYLKLKKGTQIEKVYNQSSDKGNQYLMNNLIGSLGEIVFSELIREKGFKFGISVDGLESFRNSDICDFFTSKTGKTIDVKTVYKENASSLIINKGISNWRKIDFYVLVKLDGTETVDNVEDIFSFKSATVVGYVDFRSLSSNEKYNRTMYGQEVYMIHGNETSNVDLLLEENFFKISDGKVKYEAKGNLILHASSFETGPIGKLDFDLIQSLTKHLASQDEKENHFNFHPVYIEDRLVLSFPIYKGDFYLALFLKALVIASNKARMENSKLIIPDYIRELVLNFSKNKELTLVRIKEEMRELNCEVSCSWI